MRRLAPWLILFVGLLAALAVAPAVALVFAAFNLAAFMLVASIRLVAAWGVRTRRREGQALALPNEDAPFVSIHVPIHDEPPTVVMRTLDALARLRYRRFEVIVLDNNTTNPAVWRPVQAHCGRLGSRFRFAHIENLEGAKAGALEVCRRMMDPRTRRILVIDADYRVKPTLLQRSRRYFTRGVSFVQFPQAYENGTKESAGLTDDYAHYFELFLPFAEACDATLLTGTLCMIDVDALERAGGWSASTLTEDAELGLRLNLAGVRGRYAPEVGGRGLMPTDLEGLRTQRRRWVFGNAQTLAQLGWRHVRDLGLRRSLGVVAQLTAWFDFLLLPVAVLIVAPFVPLEGARWWAAALAASTLGLHVFVHALVLLIAPSHLERRPRTLMRALLVHLGLAWEGATAWVEAWTGRRLGFQRTDKSSKSGSWRKTLPHIVTATTLLAAAGVYLWRGMPWLGLGALVGAGVMASALYLHRELGRVRRADLALPRGEGLFTNVSGVHAAPILHTKPQTKPQTKSQRDRSGTGAA